jgi:hypothetical protein
MDLPRALPEGRRERGARLALLQRSFFYLFLAGLLAGCGASGSEDESSTSSAPPASAVSLTADPVSVPDNGFSTLTWSATNQLRCQASGGWSGAKGASGSVTVGPLAVSTVYVFACQGLSGITTKAVTVTVGIQPPPPPPTVSLSANPTSVGLNETTTLTWSSTNADDCQALDDWAGSKPTSGSESSAPLAADSTFTLVCGGAGGTTSQSVTVTVDALPPPPAPTVSLSANPLSVNYNGSSTLSWSSTNATSCTASGDWSGSKATSGSQTRSSLTTTSTFILTCTGAGGSATRSVTVSVAPQGIGTADLSWMAPSTNEDGSALMLASFNIYWGTSSGNLQKIASVSASQTAYTATGLSAGTHYFAVTAVSDTGAESTFSNIESKQIF